MHMRVMRRLLIANKEPFFAKGICQVFLSHSAHRTAEAKSILLQYSECSMHTLDDISTYRKPHICRASIVYITANNRILLVLYDPHTL